MADTHTWIIRVSAIFAFGVVLTSTLRAQDLSPTPLTLTEVDPKIAAHCRRWDNDCVSCTRSSYNETPSCKWMVFEYQALCRPVRVRCKAVLGEFRRVCLSYTDFCNTAFERAGGGLPTARGCGEGGILVKEIACLKWAGE
jgi:hypothetical protein